VKNPLEQLAVAEKRTSRLVSPVAGISTTIRMCPTVLNVNDSGDTLNFSAVQQHYVQ
jgi:hypothetical protein